MKRLREITVLADALRRTNRQALSIWKGSRFWVVVLCVAVVCAYGGPFGTYEAFPAGLRLLYWLLIAIATAMAGTWVSELTFALRLRFLPSTVLVSGVFGLLVTAIVAALQSMLDQALDRPADVYKTLMLSFPAGVVVFLAANRLMHPSAIAAGAEPEPANRNDTRPRLLDRLGKGVDAGEIHSLTAQDHYVEVTTDRGKELCLIRLSDAIAECDGVEGFQVHRSHWVAIAAIKRLDTGGARPSVVLKNGAVLPVSRARVRPLKQLMRQSRRSP